MNEDLIDEQFPEDLIDEQFPEDEIDYYFQISNESENIGRQMINTEDPIKKKQLTERYMQLQQWLSEISFNNIWND